MSIFIKHLTTNKYFAVLILVLLSFIFFVGLGHNHLFDWDEINFAESAREMIESNNYLRVQINYQSFWEKPPFFFWLQVVSMFFFGINEFAARFPNAFFGLIYLLTFFYIGRKHFNQTFGIIWALIYFGSLLPHIYFKSGIIDPIFNYFIFISIYFMMIAMDKCHKKKSTYAFLSGIFSGLSVITKGPVGFLLLALTFVTYTLIKRFKISLHIKYILFFILGIIIIISIWLFIEYFQNGYDMLIKFIRYQVELFNSDVAGHKQPFYYHFLVVFVGCFPISIIALPKLFKKNINTPLDIQKWMVCIFWVVMITFSIVTTKIIHYSSMSYIPISFLATLYLNSVINKQIQLKKYVLRLFLLIGLLIGLIITLIPLILINKEIIFPYINDDFAIESLKNDVHWNGMEFMIGIYFITGVIISFLLFKKEKIIKTVITISSTIGLTLIFILFFIIPKIEKITQGPVIEFYSSLEDKDVYVECFGYKSYAQYFYTKQPYGLKNDRLNKDWLLNGNIDKPVYLVSKSTNMELDNNKNFKLIKSKGGFRFYKRLNTKN
ncbi:MAG: glycosyl transferase [Crocinitomicaceae bacterium]|nr:glycosyl transferase [Crocinitomicaceae bacterium]|tara:strand:+ start:44723 stop:46372 length:1650 start_codon:yes stop_codon:yes gene_type:complete